MDRRGEITLKKQSKKLPPILAAKSVVRKLNASKHITPRERDVVAKALVGEISPDNPSVQDSPLVQDAIIEALAKLGIDEQYLAQHMKAGLEAEDTQFSSFQGMIMDERQIPAWATRHKYFESLRDMAGMTSKAKEGGNSIGAVHFHYKSYTRGEPVSVSVAPPKESKAQRRLIAARPTNRKGA